MSSVVLFFRPLYATVIGEADFFGDIEAFLAGLLRLLLGERIFDADFEAVLV